MKKHRSSSTFSRGGITFIGNYLPRRCGIATFTADLYESISSQSHRANNLVVALSDTPNHYAYPPQVRLEVEESDIRSYWDAAEFLNASNTDLVCLQHEFGIFGGISGSYILELIARLNMPVVTTLHTVLKNPDLNQRTVLQQVIRCSERVVVMSKVGMRLLEEVYRIPQEKIDFIPHGIPDVPFVESCLYKDRFGLQGKNVLLTFGLISQNKGLENVIESLPMILEHCPNVVYFIVGSTHPNVKKNEGESYRLGLMRLAKELGVEDHVVLHDGFVRIEELIEYLQATDIYVTPYLNPEQSVSGTLAYAVGAGKAVISTPYWYAEEILSDGRGMLVPFKNPKAIARAAVKLLANEIERFSVRKRAYEFGREMIWARVAQRYMQTFQMAQRTPVISSNPLPLHFAIKP